MPIFSSLIRQVSIATVPGTQAVPTGAETTLLFNAPAFDELAAFQTPGIFSPAPGAQAFYRGDVWIQIAGVGGAGEYWARLAAVQTGPGGAIISKTMNMFNQDAFDKFIALPIRILRALPVVITLEHSAGANRTVTGGVWTMSFEGWVF